ncbi:sulfur oxidation c-type cytochrome SoxX [Lamprobacter modestohalophilus]|uniref:Sulfur oxidation c-type cytochrome SoxX n=1 Tax=Lamprobacter modestohalophilus TaxID=1064514 RepID=A0A9X0WBY8_9GAMM|nr:sulfur oxidation c-type cytochrome SoxX [Lamprobacter modestohalophilus]MBK1620892.1 sulfur oxidation c-type cytochrome SoxX [Lamprobacter modestohalophilus]MCF7977327.1 sulfur oxidation c-type cytochrome SoxX [Chromatiaceae bacterium]MCF7994929.1 sulfur oxidation c-type cytochrome SoxX [Chromatiaceae bacterium]MCF8017597.1 sulfur oxidation c-type cytochrome SoxX [Chromatiaceae bacterium]
MSKQFNLASKFVALAALSISSAALFAAEVDYTKMTPEELAEYLIFEAGGFKLDQEVQEGGTTRQRMEQDWLQKTCSSIDGTRPDMDTLLEVSQKARETITYPEDGIKLGDWKRGRDLAWSGYGFRVGHRVDDHENNEVGGNCYNCHQIGTDRTGGSIGPSLVGYGRIRGDSDAIKKYTYDVIYNSHSAFPCTNMPRFGVSGYLDQQSMADIMAYLLDPESPVNQ